MKKKTKETEVSEVSQGQACLMIWGKKYNRGMIQNQVDDLKKFFTESHLNPGRKAGVLAYVGAIEKSLISETLKEILYLEKNQAPSLAWPRGELIRMSMYNIITRTYPDLETFLKYTEMSCGGSMFKLQDQYLVVDEEAA